MPEDHPDAGAVPVVTATQGAGEVQTVILSLGIGATARQTAITPAAGKKIRLIAAQLSQHAMAVSDNSLSVYFGTGASVTTDVTKAIICHYVETGELRGLAMVWPDGAGPVGAVDEVLSVRNPAYGMTTYCFQWREE